MSARDLPTRHPLAHRVLVSLGLVVLTAMLVAVARYNATADPGAPLELPTSLLFQLRDDDGTAVVSALISPRGGDWLVFPADLGVGSGLTISTAAQGLDVRRSGQSLADQTGIEVGETWQLDRVGLSALIDIVGGVSVTVDETVRLEDGNGGLRVLRQGETAFLEPNYGSRYATSGSPESQARHTVQVLRDLFRRLDAAALPNVLQSVGSSSRSTLGTPWLVHLIERLQQQNSAKPFSISQLDSRIAITPDGFARVLTPAAVQRVKAAGVSVQPVP